MKNIAISILILSLNGCAWVSGYFGGKDNAEPPAELTDIKSEFEVTQIWNVDTGSGSGGQLLKLQPAVKAGKVYAAGSKGSIFSIDVKSGEILWNIDTKTRISAGPGISTSSLYVGTRNAELLSYDILNGKNKWKAPLSSEVLAIPQEDDGIVVVRTIDGKIIGLSAESGKKLWQYDRKEPSLTLRGTSSPIIAEGIVLVGFDNGKLAAIGLRKGQLLWERQIAVPHGRSELERIVDIDGDPIVRDGIVYVVTFQGRMAAVDLQSGELYWNRNLSSFAGIGSDRKKLFVTDEKSHVWAVSRSNGASLWKQDKLTARSVTRPVSVGKYVVVGDYEGYIHWLSGVDGHFVSRIHAVGDGVASMPIVVGDSVIAQGGNGELAAFRIKR